MAHLVMHRGETRTFQIEVNDSAGANVNLTGAVLSFATYNATGGVAVFTVVPTLVDAINGLAQVVIPAASTAGFSAVDNTTLYYVLRRTIGGFVDVVGTGLITIRALS